MKLLHLEPLIFAKEILFLEENSAEVLCVFQENPSFAIFVETAAQATAAFFQNAAPTTGYLANVSNMELLQPIEQKEYIVHLEKLFSFDKLLKYSFFIVEKKERENIVVKGELTIAME